MYIVSIDTKETFPEWFKLRLFSTSEEAIKWSQSVTGDLIMMTPDENTEMCSVYSCGDLTVRIKKVIVDDKCPDKYQLLLSQILEAE